MRREIVVTIVVEDSHEPELGTGDLADWVSLELGLLSTEAAGVMRANPTKMRVMGVRLGAPTEQAVEAERRRIADQLDRLGDHRMEYVTGVGGERIGAEEYHALIDSQKAVYHEANAANWLASIVRGENDGKGWLPSWRWET